MVRAQARLVGPSAVFCTASNAKERGVDIQITKRDIYKHVWVNYGSTIIGLGLLNDRECLELATQLRDAADLLCEGIVQETIAAA